MYKSPEEFHNKLGLIFHAMLALPLAAFIYLFLEKQNNELQPVLEDSQTAMILTIAFMFMSLTDVVMAYFLFKGNLKKIDNEKPLPERLQQYFTYNIIFYALIEGASIVLVVGLYLTTSAFFIVGYVLLLFLMSLHRPTPQKYVNDLRLSGKERDVIIHKRSFDTLDD